MAFYKRYRIPFQSKEGTQYMLYIYEQTSGSVTTLTGAENPFETSEKYDDDFLTPIREQTGYIRVIDETESGNLMETLMPTNNLSKMVKLYTGSWSGGSFTDSTCVWRGFMCANAFTQSWDKQKKVVEFPVKSILGVAQDLYLPSTAAGAIRSFALLLDLLFTELDNILAPSSVTVISSLYHSNEDLFLVDIQFPVFFEQEEIDNQGDSTVELIGQTYYEAISSVLKMYGFMMREDGEKIYIAQYDEITTASGNQTLWTALYPWAYVHTMAHSDTPISPSVAALVTFPNLLDNFTFKGRNNMLSFMQGHKAVKITVQATDKLPFKITLPLTTEDSSTVRQITPISNCQAYVQPHPPRSNNLETYNYYGYIGSGNPVTASYADCMMNSVMDMPLYKQYDTVCIMGAFPCRWKSTLNSTLSAVLKNGILLNQLYVSNATESMPTNIIYSIKSPVSYSFVGGYLNIQFNNYNFELGNVGSPDSQLYFGGKSVSFMNVKLRFGTKYWSGSQWVSNDRGFILTVDGDHVASNKTTDMNVDESAGYFIPVDSSLSGDIEFSFRCYATAQFVNAYQIVHSRIISDLNIQYLPTIDETASQRTENVYRKSIVSSGFTDEIENSLELGTLNNNIKSQRFLMRYYQSYIQTLAYNAGNSYQDIRPEMNLLNRMSVYYSRTRRTMTAIGKPLVDIFNKVFRDSQLRDYFAVDAKHNWRDDTQEIKFIEVS